MIFIGFEVNRAAVCRDKACVARIPEDGITRVIRKRGQITVCSYCRKYIGA